MSTHLFARLCAPILLLAGLFAMVPISAAGDGERHILVLGRISDDPKIHYEQLKPLLDYVVPRMADVGIREGRILMARDAQQMTSYLRRGQVDWVTETAASAMLLQSRGNVEPMLLTERDGVSRYRTVFFVRRDSGLARLEDLAGRSVAFQNNASTSAYFVPAIELLRRKLSLSLLLSPMDKPSRGNVGYVFARSELNIGAWVHKRLVDVGAMSDLDWNNPARVPPSFRKDLEVIHITESVPRALEMVRADLDPKVQARLREVLIEAAADPKAAQAMRHFFRTTRFLPIDDSSSQVLARLRTGVAQVKADVE
jgi:phosphonate transport system substrate-binding protein